MAFRNNRIEKGGKKYRQERTGLYSIFHQGGHNRNSRYSHVRWICAWCTWMVVQKAFTCANQCIHGPWPAVGFDRVRGRKASNYSLSRKVSVNRCRQHSDTRGNAFLSRSLYWSTNAPHPLYSRIGKRRKPTLDHAR